VLEVARELVPDDAYDESPVFLDAPDGAVFGIVTFPRIPRDRTAVIVLASGGTPLTTNRNRVSVRMCRGLASLGYTAFRMDYHGTGESSGTVDSLHLGRPFVGDALAAVAYLKGLGMERFILLGSCFGSRTALAAGSSVEEVETVIALATPLRDFAMGERHSQNAAMTRSLGRYVLESLRPRTIKGYFDRRTRAVYRRHARAKLRLVRDRVARVVPWSTRAAVATGAVSPRFEGAVADLVDRNVPIIFVYGEDEDYYEEFRNASDGDLAELRARAGSLIQVVTVPGRVHGLTTVAVQDAVVDLILEWARERRDEADPVEMSTAGDEPR
jgi:alpha/beta superfamily hydrolase